MYRVFGMATSGNCYKVQLLLEQLGEPYVAVARFICKYLPPDHDAWIGRVKAQPRFVPMAPMP